MAHLHDGAKSLRLQLTFADRDNRPLPGTPLRALARAAVEHFDQKDRAYWPFVRLTSLWLGLEEAEGLQVGLERVVRGELPGLMFRSAIASDLALQIGRDQSGAVQVEVGIDLRGYLRQHAGLASGDGERLALFRFATTQAELVRFADELRGELRELRERDQSRAP